MKKYLPLVLARLGVVIISVVVNASWKYARLCQGLLLWFGIDNCVGGGGILVVRALAIRIMSETDVACRSD